MLEAFLLASVIVLLAAATILQALNGPHLAEARRFLPFAIGPLLLVAGLAILLRLSTYL